MPSTGWWCTCLKNRSDMRRAAALVLCLMATTAAAEIREARYADRSSAYGHWAMGETGEWDSLEILSGSGQWLRFAALPGHVFEDATPHLADLDGDGDVEVIVVESSPHLGARLAVWDETGPIAAAPHIGQSFRWLAVIGAADLDGDGRIEIAYIDRPHLARELKLWRLGPEGLTPAGASAGLTNHRLGSPQIEGGIRDCGEGPELILADADWRSVLAVRWDGARFTARDLGAYQGPGSMVRALGC